MKALMKFFGVAFLIFCLLSSCEKPTEPSENIADLIVSAGSFEVPQEKNEIINSDTATVNINGVEWECETKTYSVVNCPDNYPNFNPNAEILFPGNLLQGKTLSQATPEPIVVKRGPGKVVLATLNASQENLSEQVPEVTLSYMNDAMNKILARIQNPYPANFVFSKEEVQSREQLALEMNASYESLSFDAKSRLEFSTDHEYNRYLIKLNQSYFTYAYELPTSLEQVFAPDVTAQDLQKYIQKGNPPAYISSITYGRIFYFLFESTSSKFEIEASLDASFEAAVSSGTWNGKTKYMSELENRKIKVFALGGEPNKALAAATGSFEDLKAFVTEGGTISTGVPLSYNIRSLASNQTVYNKVATEYAVKECELAKGQKSVKLTVDQLVVTKSDDEGAGNNADVDNIDVWILAFNGPDKDGKEGNLVSKPSEHKYGTNVFHWDGYATVGEGHVFQTKKTFELLIFNDVDNDFNGARILLSMWHKEDDNTSDDYAEGTSIIYGKDFFSNDGHHSFTVTGSDLGIRCEYTIELYDF